MTEERLAVLESERATNAANLRIRMLADLAIPPLYEHATLETFQLHGPTDARNAQQRAHALAQRWVALWPDVPILQLWRGGPGTGKGHLLYAIARRLVTDCSVRAQVVKLADMIRALRAGWRDREADAEDVVLARLRRRDWLAIDEVSGHAFRGEPKQHLYDVVDYRLEHLRPTVLTSNEPTNTLAELLGPALLSRINGAGGVIEFGITDYRSRQR